MNTVKYNIFLYGEKTVPVGVLHCISARGKNRAVFSYARSWLESRAAFPIDPALPLTEGTFSPPENKELFTCFSDATPDRWGRRLLLLNERYQAARERRAARSLSETDCLLCGNDFSRMGAFMLLPEGATFPPPVSDKGVIPPLNRLRALMNAALRVTSDEADTAGSVELLCGPGASLGGARPKVSLLDPRGNLLIAKFPGAKDRWDVPLWEYIAFSLARDAGIDVPIFDKEQLCGKTVFLVRRFDRSGESRIHFASAMTLLGATDGDHGTYEDIAAVLMESGVVPDQDMSQLWRRMVFNILINNTDDHLRNHAFLRDKNGWRLSPVYDLESSPASEKTGLHTAISRDTDETSIDVALASASNFNLSLKDAEQILKECFSAVRKWHTLARACGALRRDMDLLADSFRTNIHL